MNRSRLLVFYFVSLWNETSQRHHNQARMLADVLVCSCLVALDADEKGSLSVNALNASLKYGPLFNLAGC